MDNGLYTGKGVQCEVRYHQLAGFRPRVLKANESFPLIHAWFATFPSQWRAAITRFRSGCGPTPNMGCWR